MEETDLPVALPPVPIDYTVFFRRVEPVPMTPARQFDELCEELDIAPF